MRRLVGDVEFCLPFSFPLSALLCDRDIPPHLLLGLDGSGCIAMALRLFIAVGDKMHKIDGLIIANT